MVGLLHAMAFMVLLLIGWVIWNNKPLPLPLPSILEITWSCVCDHMVNSVDLISLKFLEKDAVRRGHIIRSITLTVFGNLYYEQILHACRRSHNSHRKNIHSTTTTTNHCTYCLPLKYINNVSLHHLKITTQNIRSNIISLSLTNWSCILKLQKINKTESCFSLFLKAHAWYTASMHQKLRLQYVLLSMTVWLPLRYDVTRCYFVCFRLLCKKNQLSATAIR